MLWQRIITSLILLPIVIGAIFLPDIYFGFVVAVLLTLAAWEWAKLTNLSKRQQAIYLFALWAAFALCVFVSPLFVSLISILAWLCALFGALYFVLRYPNVNKKIFIKGGCYWSLLILVPCFVGLNILHVISIPLLFMALFIVWAADIGGYFIGKFFGKHNLAPKVSPKKTIEGLVGGVLLALFISNSYSIYLEFGSLKLINFIGWAALIISGLYIFLTLGKRILNKKGYLKLSFLELVFIIIIAIIYCLVWEVGFQDWRLLLKNSLIIVVVVLLAVLGDLFESLLKRIAEVKDSGTLLPGHGGVLDRIDGLLFAVPVFILLLLLSGF